MFNESILNKGNVAGSIIIDDPLFSSARMDLLCGFSLNEDWHMPIFTEDAIEGEFTRIDNPPLKLLESDDIQ
jgi:hypothetical protein